MRTSKPIPIDCIQVDPTRWPLRRLNLEEHISYLQGVLAKEPNAVPRVLLWREPGRGGKYQLLAGHEVVEAYRRRGLTAVPAFVLSGSEDTALLAAVADLKNSSRRLCAWEKAHIYGFLYAKAGRPSLRKFELEQNLKRSALQPLIKVAEMCPEAETVAGLLLLGVDPEELASLSTGELYAAALEVESNGSRPEEAVAARIREKTVKRLRKESGRKGAGERKSPAPTANEHALLAKGVEVTRALLTSPRILASLLLFGVLARMLLW